ncbi:MAG: hypothetical protein COT18_10845, partial [Elusimicrobia bacterium CG08_land_8_20_14_0_20_59_10]
MPYQPYHNRAQITTLRGSVLDWLATPGSYSGVAPGGIELRIVDVTGGNTLYNGAGVFDTNDDWRPVSVTWYGANDSKFGVYLSSSASWSYPSGGETWPPTLTEDNVYKVKVRSRDRSNNTEAAYVEYQFTYDNYAPTTTITMPGTHAYTDVPSFYGTYEEAVSGISPGNGVQLVITQVGPPIGYWNGTDFNDAAFVPATHWRNATSIAGGNWVYDDANLAAVFDGLRESRIARAYTVSVLGRDAIGNVNKSTSAVPAADSQFTIDPVVPVSTVTFPTDGAWLNVATSTLAGTASDWSVGAYSGLNSVAMRISRLDSGSNRTYYQWMDKIWTTQSSDWYWKPVDADLSPWTVTIGTAAFLDTNNGNGYRFELQARAIDNTETANGGPNTEVDYATSTFVLDFSTPTVAITAPGHNTYFNMLSSLAGTAPDPAGAGGIPSGLKELWLELIDTDRSPAQYWNFATGAWQTGYSSGPITALENWTVAAASLPVNSPPAADDSWSVGRTSATFVLKAKALDRAGNYTDFALNQSSFTLDLSIPISTFTSPPYNDSFEQIASSITGTAQDFAAFISTVQLTIQQDSSNPGCSNTGRNGMYWTGSGWQGPEKWLGVTSYNPGNYSWEYNSAGVDWAANCYFIIRSSAADYAGNGQSSFGYRRFKFVPPPSHTAVTSPADGRYYKAISQISGTANTDTKSINLYLSRLSDGWYWNFNTKAWQEVSVATTIAPSTNWTYSPLPAELEFLSGSSYTVTSVGLSFANVTESGNLVNEIYFDTAAPSISVQLPAAAQVYYNAMPRLGGPASDPPGTSPPAAGINKVWAELRDLNGPSAGKYWDNAASSYTIVSWTPTDANLGSYFVSGSSWEYVVSYPTAAFSDGARYQVRALALDNTYADTSLTGNESPYATAVQFYFDITVPTATVTAVAAGARRSGVALASGAIQEALVTGASWQPGEQIQAIKLHIRNNNLGMYWTGSGWSYSSSVSTDAAVYQSSWAVTAVPAPGVWIDTYSYTMWAEAFDKAGNAQTNFSGNGSSVTFTIDKTAPVATITSIQTGARITSLTSITGAANDPDWASNSGIAAKENIQVQLSYLYGSDTYYYDNSVSFSSSAYNDGNSWWPATAWYDLGPSSGTWEYASSINPAMVSDRAYRVRVRAQDNAVPVANPADLFANIAEKYDIVFDTTPPVVVATSPVSGAKLKYTPNIYGTASAALSGLKDVRIDVSSYVAGAWAEAGFTSQAATIWSSSWAWTGLSGLTSGATYQVVARAQDNALNWTPVYSTLTFVYDATLPSVSIAKPVADQYYGNNASEPDYYLSLMNGSASDAFGIDRAEIRLREMTTPPSYLHTTGWVIDVSSWLVAGQGNWQYPTPSFNDGYRYMLEARAYDIAGNLSAYTTHTFYYDNTVPGVSLSAPNTSGFHKSLP